MIAMKITLVTLTALCLFGCNSQTNLSLEDAEKAFLRTYATQALNDFHLQYLGATSPPGDTIEAFGARYMTKELHTLDQARDLVKTSSERFIQEANKDPNLKKYFKESIFDLSQLDYYISFWDENTDRPPKPYVALATVKEGQITYYFKSDDSEFLDNAATITESLN